MKLVMLVILLPVVASTAAFDAPLDPAPSQVGRRAATVSPSAMERSEVPMPARDACEVPGKAIQWQVDYCLFRSETDDVIAAQPCMDREDTRRFSSECARKRHYKHRLCELQVGAGVREGSIEHCVRDPEFSGKAVRNDGV